MADLGAALCLLVVIEGLVLFAVPGAWKRAMAQLLGVPDGALRRVGAALFVLGLVSLYVVRA